VLEAQTSPLAPSHSVSGLMLTLRLANTVTVALPDCTWEQAVLLASCTLTNVYTKLPEEFVDAETVTELPPEVVTVLFDPPLILYVKV